MSCQVKKSLIFKILLVWATVFFITGLLLIHYFSFNDYTSEKITFTNKGKVLKGKIYLPAVLGKKLPAVIVCHGIACSKESMEHICLELVKEGFIAFAFDFGGHGESYLRVPDIQDNIEDVQSAVNYLKTRKDVDLDNLYAVGHSMGGTAVGCASYYADFKGLVILGMIFPASETNPKNLLFGVGLYDQLHFLPYLRDTLSQATNKQNNQIAVLTGLFSKGTARMLIVSPFSDHAGETFDPLILKSTVEWLKQSNQQPATSVRITESFKVAGITLFLVGSFLLTITLLLLIPPLKNSRLLSVIFIGLIVLTAFSKASYNIGGNIILLLYGLLITLNYVRHSFSLGSEKDVFSFLAKKTSCFLFYSVIFWLVIVVFCFLINGLLVSPSLTNLLSFPLFLVSHAVFTLYLFLTTLKVLFLTTDLQLRLIFLVLLAVELIKPALTLTAVAKLISSIIAWLEGKKDSKKTNKKWSILLLTVLLIIAVILWIPLAKSDVITAQLLFLVSIFMARYLFLPLVILLIFFRIIVKSKNND